jgi:hypothetical protein
MTVDNALSTPQGTVMNTVAGIFLLFVFVAMLWIGKPRNGVHPTFMRSWIV